MKKFEISNNYVDFLYLLVGVFIGSAIGFLMASIIINQSLHKSA